MESLIISEEKESDKMRGDYDYCFETLAETYYLKDAIETIKTIAKEMANNGHLISYSDMLDYKE